MLTAKCSISLRFLENRDQSVVGQVDSLISIGPSEVCANSGATLGRPLFFVILFCIFVIVNLAKYRVIKSK
jgi:hypothetical protein